MIPKKEVEEFFSNDIEVNEDGGGQSAVRFRFDLLDPYAMFCMAEVMKQGATRYAPDNWRLIDCDTHINHGIGHAFEYLRTRDPEALTHAMTRFMMAVATSDDKQAADSGHVRSLLVRRDD